MLFIKDYLLWHYSSALKRIFHIWNNFFWFIVAFFSITQLLKSLFLPWKRVTEERGRSFSFEDLASFIIIGFISRMIGFILRFTIIVIGVTSATLLSLGLVVVFVFWILAPIIIPLLFALGLFLLFK